MATIKYEYRPIVWLLRFIVGAVFIFSGFVKAVDPSGFLFKINDYLAFFDFEIWHNLKITGVYLLCLFEFTIGIFLLFGCFRKSTPLLGFIFMCVMTPFSLWIAMTDPVADCGCFGDALLISNWQTFWKNLFLIISLFYLICFNKKSPCIIHPALQWICLIGTAVYLVTIEFLGYNYQPLLDFRDYKVGKSLISQTEEQDIPELSFVYEKDGLEKEFNESEIPDHSWKFVRRVEKDKVISKKSSEFSKNLILFDTDGDEVYDAIEDKGEEMILTMPELSKVSPATTWKINSLYEWCEKNNIKFIAVVSGSPSDIDEWEDIALPDYPIFIAEDTELKELVRGNPAILFLDNGKIMWKSSLAFIDVDEFKKTELDAGFFPLGYSDHTIILWWSVLYLSFLVLLSIVSLIPNILNPIKKKSKFIHDDNSRHEGL